MRLNVCQGVQQFQHVPIGMQGQQGELLVLNQLWVSGHGQPML